MNKSIVVAILIVALSGCSSASKTSKSTSTTTNPFMASTQKLGQDYTQTKTDLSSLESEAKLSK